MDRFFEDNPFFTAGRHGGRHFSAGHSGFFGRFGKFMGGPGFRAAKMLASGDLQLIILHLLAEKPRHGYEVIKAIEAVGSRSGKTSSKVTISDCGKVQ